MSTAPDALLDDLNSIDEAEAKKATALARLLDEALKKSGHVLVVKSEMGIALKETGHSVKVPSYLAVKSLNWAGNPSNLKMGNEMPFMEKYILEDGKVRIDESNANDIAQRAPDWTRQPELTAYLLHDQDRKFGTIMAVVSPAWIDNPKHENWGPKGVAMRSAIEFKALDSQGNVGLVDLTDTPIYALDGQHRVMGIRGLHEVQNGRLNLLSKSGEPTKKSYTREQFLQMVKVSPLDLNAIMEETVSVELIPAVVRGETAERAKQRIRSIFVAVNSYAKRTEKGENILLDEKDGYSIIARRVALNHKLLKAVGGQSRVNFKNTALPARSNWLTTLQALREMSKAYLGETEAQIVEGWEHTLSGAVPMRPAQAELENAEAAFRSFLDAVSTLPTMRDLIAGADLDSLREFPVKGKGHLLLRPVGQEVLALAVGKLVSAGMALEKIFEKLNRFDADGGFEQATPEGVWYDITYDGDKAKMIMSKKELAADLLVYLVQGANSEAKSNLLARVRAARTDNARGEWRNFSGKHVPLDHMDPSSDLPSPIPAK